jgi:hypothetical protein
MTSQVLEIPTHDLSAQLQEPLVREYVVSILKEHGMQHMEKIASKMDDLIERKWEELEEAEVGSNKDIAELLNIAHKMRMDMQKHLAEDTKAVKNQKNIQVNNFDGSNYHKLIEKLVG